MIKSIDLRVSLSDQYLNRDICLHEGDINGTELVLNVYENSTEFDLSDCNAEYDATIDGFLAEEGTPATISGTNKIKVPVTTNMTARSGELLIDVKIKKNNDILTVYTVSADVKRAVINGATVIDISGTTIMQRLDHAVPDSRKITDTLDLSEDITTEQLRAVLGVSKKDLVYTNEVFKTFDEATDQETLYLVCRTMYGAALGYLRYYISRDPSYITEMQIWLHETGKITYRTKVTTPTTSGEWSNWINYLTNEDSYTKNEVNNLISAISTLSFEVKQTKPVSDIKTNVIYLIPKSDTAAENFYDEWIYINNSWELIGSTAIDLSQYAKKADIPTKVSEFQNDSGYLTQHQDLSAYATKQEVNTALATKADSDSVKAFFTRIIDDSYEPSEVLTRYNVLLGRRLVSSGGGATDENYDIDRFYPLTAGSLLKIKATADSDYIYQFQSAISIGSTNLVAGPFSGAIDDYVVVPDSAVCLSICHLKTNTTNNVTLYTAKNAASEAALKSTVKQDSESIEQAELDELGEIEAEQSAVDEDK